MLEDGMLCIYQSEVKIRRTMPGQPESLTSWDVSRHELSVRNRYFIKYHISFRVFRRRIISILHYNDHYNVGCATAMVVLDVTFRVCVTVLRLDYTIIY